MTGKQLREAVSFLPCPAGPVVTAQARLLREQRLKL